MAGETSKLLLVKKNCRSFTLLAPPEDNYKNDAKKIQRDL